MQSDGKIKSFKQVIKATLTQSLCCYTAAAYLLSISMDLTYKKWNCSAWGPVGLAVALHGPVYIILSLSALLAPRCKLTSSEVFVNTHTHSSRRKCKNTYYFPPHPPLTRANYSNDNQCTTERPRLKPGNFAIFSRAKQLGKSVMQKSSSNSANFYAHCFS